MRQKKFFQSIIIAIFITFGNLFFYPSKALAFWKDTLFFLLGVGADLVIDNWSNPQQFSGDYLIETIPDEPKFATLYLPSGSAVLVPSKSKKITPGKLGGVAIRGAYSSGGQLTVSVWNPDLDDFYVPPQKYNRIIAGGVFNETIVRQESIDEYSTYFEALDYESGYYSFARSTFHEGEVYFLNYKCPIQVKDEHQEFARQTLNALKYK